MAPRGIEDVGHDAQSPTVEGDARGWRDPRPDVTPDDSPKPAIASHDPATPPIAGYINHIHRRRFHRKGRK